MVSKSVGFIDVGNDNHWPTATQRNHIWIGRQMRLSDIGAVDTGHDQVEIPSIIGNRPVVLDAEFHKLRTILQACFLYHFSEAHGHFRDPSGVRLSQLLND